MSKEDKFIIRQRARIVQWLGTGSINLFGIPFAGKDTQAKRLAEWLKASVISGGDILRHHRLPASDQKALDVGNLIPVEDYLRILVPYLSQPELANKPLILSAVGHQEGEEQSIMDATSHAGHQIKTAILLDVDENTAQKRWINLEANNDRGRRLDDADGVFQHRLEEFRIKTLPVLEYYRERGLLLEVDGSGTPDEVEAAILAALYGKVTQEN